MLRLRDLRVHPLLHAFSVLAVVAFALSGCAGDDDDDNGGGGPGITTFSGVAAGSGVSGSLSVTVGTSSPAPAGTSRLTRPATVFTATGTFTPTGGAAVALTGTYDDQSNVLALSGGGYAFVGTYANGVLSGTFTGPGGTDGAFALQVSTSASAQLTFCGNYDSEVGGAGGDFNLVIGATTVSGVAYDIDEDTSIPLTGTIDAEDSLHISIAVNPPILVAVGTMASDSSSVSGVYDNQSGDSGTWSGVRCGTPAAITSQHDAAESAPVRRSGTTPLLASLGALLGGYVLSGRVGRITRKPRAGARTRR